MDIDAVKQQVEQELESVWAKVAEGAENDLKLFAERISENLTHALINGDAERVAEMRAQAKALAASYRIRLNEAGWDLVLKGVQIAVAALTS